MQPTLEQWLNRKTKGKAPRKPLPKMSAKRQREARVYSVKRKAFLAAHPWCQIWLIRRGIKEHQVREAEMIIGSRAIVIGDDPKNGFSAWQVGWIPPSQEVHHVKRRRRFYLDETTWLAASREEHEWCHQNPKEARALNILQ